MTIDEVALFEVLNAKKMAPHEIAASFVRPPQFDQLVAPDHTFLVGPRGSGKTTLLRMLQGEALSTWRDNDADNYRSRIRYSGVFLPADRLWASQLEFEDASISNDVGITAFTTQLLYALVETMLYRLGEYESSSGPVHLPAQLRHRDEVALVAECAEAWRINIATPSLLALQGALDLRLNVIADAVDRAAREGGGSVGLTDSWQSIAPLESLRFGMAAFNRYTKDRNHRWALLLDEMELAPAAVHRSLRSTLRGGDKNLILKLSFSPFDRYAAAESGVGGAFPDNDFRTIYLWYGSRTGGRKFTGALWNRMMNESSDRTLPAARVLGQSEIDVSGSTWGPDAYKPGSKRMELIRRMARSDASFAEYLRRNSVDLANVSKLSYDKRSATLRKAYPLLVFRDALLDFSGNTPRRRARKKITECFTGSDAVFAALEGNPRWIKAVFSQLLSAYDGELQLQRGFQYDVLVDAAERFESLLRMLPADGPSRAPVLPLLDGIASYFSARACGAFTVDPPSVFRVDQAVPPDIHDALKTALAAGAIVHLRGKRSPPVLDSLIGERFRLAYLLTIRDGFEVPMRTGKTRNLSSILTVLQDATSRTRPSEAGDGEQPSLWSS